MKLGSLFSGFGGLDQAVNAFYGSETAWVSDIDEGACKILAHHHPGVPNLGDITAVDWATVEPVDILTGGFPCQDLSHAGKRAGLKVGTRSGLWSLMATAIDHLRPKKVVIENVRGLLSACAHSDLEPCPGCVGDGKHVPVLRALGRVLADLADLGYDAQWHGLRAADIGAPHNRFRVFIVATPQNTNGTVGGEWRVAAPRQEAGGRSWSDTGGRDREPVALLPTPLVTDGATASPADLNRKSPGLRALALLPTPAVNDMGAGKTVEAWDEWTDRMKAKHGNGNGHGSSGDLMLPSAVQRWGDYGPAIARWEQATRPAPSPTIAGKNGGRRLNPVFVEWMMGLPAGHVTSPAIGLTINQQLKALGNGVVPQQAYAGLAHMESLTERTAA